MVHLKFIVLDGRVELRISEGKTRYYKLVSHLLKGNPNVVKHWNEQKGCFTSRAINYKENNQILSDFKSPFQEVVVSRPDLTARQIANYFKPNKASLRTLLVREVLPKPSVQKINDFLSVVIEREKAKSGCNFELYEKLQKKCLKIVPNFASLEFADLNFDACLTLALIFAKHEGYEGTAKVFRSLLTKAHKEVAINFQILQIGDFKFSDYNPKKYDIKQKSPDVLSPQQLKQFLNLDIDAVMSRNWRRPLVELYFDFSVFMFYTFLSPCDIVHLKKNCVKPNGTIVTKRRKNSASVTIPISQEVNRIIQKYNTDPDYPYVFPIMNEEKDKSSSIRDASVKKFRNQLNCWLKKVGEFMQLDFPLYAYVFRHTAITIALDNGLSISYVSQVAGTSMEMMENHYYNGNNETNANRLCQAFEHAKG